METRSPGLAEIQKEFIKKEKPKVREVYTPFEREPDPLLPFTEGGDFKEADPRRQLSEKAREQYREVVRLDKDNTFRQTFESLTRPDGVIELDLNSEDFEEIMPLFGGSSLVLYGKMKDSGMEVVMKPEAFSDYVPQFKETKDYDRRALAVLALERFLEIDLTPPTEAANLKINGKEYRGTIQQFIPGRGTYEFSTDDLVNLYERKDEDEETGKDKATDMERMAIADIICFSGDNHQVNFLIHEGKPVTIDRSIAFSKERGFRSFPTLDIAKDQYSVYAARGESRGDLNKSPKILEKLEQLAAKKGMPEQLFNELYTKEEQDLIAEQAKLLVETKSIQKSFEVMKEKYKVF